MSVFSHKHSINKERRKNAHSCTTEQSSYFGWLSFNSASFGVSYNSQTFGNCLTGVTDDKVHELNWDLFELRPEQLGNPLGLFFWNIYSSWSLNFAFTQWGHSLLWYDPQSSQLFAPHVFLDEVERGPNLAGGPCTLMSMFVWPPRWCGRGQMQQSMDKQYSTEMGGHPDAQAAGSCQAPSGSRSPCEDPVLKAVSTVWEPTLPKGHFLRQALHMGTSRLYGTWI